MHRLNQHAHVVGTAWELDERTSELERERNEARDAASASGRAYEELEEAYRKELAAPREDETVGHPARPCRGRGRVAIICGLTWRLFT